MEDLLSRTMAAERLKVSLRTFDRMKKEGLIKAVRVGNTDFYRLQDLEEAYRMSINKGRI
ncbi:hypothetical protein [Sphingobacterium sp. LRF_L2]|uniref:hypothetical protein n=1 Tax=Sphingobacterium sp. LRF_L2 TaxID=3369421 RepID=UPI003F6210AB